MEIKETPTDSKSVPMVVWQLQIQSFKIEDNFSLEVIFGKRKSLNTISNQFDSVTLFFFLFFSEGRSRFT